jgi:hypothetical protein
MKVCRKCGEAKSLDEFYRMPGMRDGLDSKCKQCARDAVKANRDQKHEQYLEYDRLRFTRPERKAQHAANGARHNARHPDRRAARIAVSNAVRDGRLTKGPCCKCGSTARVEAHHHDYSKPLDVRWVCFRCHREEEHGQEISARIRATGT